MLREPLVQFLVLGAVLFAASRMLDHGGPKPGEIVVTPGEIENMAEVFTRMWRRPPSAEELDGLVQDHVREVILAREAVAMGLDRDDTIIRRRLRQKMEFVTGDIAALSEPTEDNLQQYFREHLAAYREESRVTLRQVFLSPTRRGERVSADAARLLAELNRNPGGEIGDTAMGDATLLPASLDDAPLSDVERTFGDEFARQVKTLAPGAWHGPVTSSYGVHLVEVQARTEGREPEFAEVRSRVKADWEDARRREANDAFYRKLLEKYRVTVEWPTSPDAATTQAQR
ncbi:MAG TPA: peptidylprolyl isomerase [Candidatus Krumholzibacteria bacterium]|nr:peptidylprolyl isomerase [Candidatus Krumholzibacteria bacterium]